MNRLINVDDIKNIELKNPLKKKKINPLAVGAAGLVVGAGVAAAITLNKNKKLRRKVASIMGDARDKAQGLTTQFMKEPEVKKAVKKAKTKTSKLKAKNK